MTQNSASKVFSEDGLSTVNILKFKYFADFVFHFSFRLLDSGIGGFVFRYRDEFTFYLLEISLEGFILNLFFDGVKTII